MPAKRLPFLLVGSALALAACDGAAPSGKTEPAVPATGSPSGTAAADPARAATPGEPEAPALALDAMDSRAPVPLLPMMAHHQKQNMRDHLLAVQEIILGLSTDDFDAVERASQRIGYSERMGQMCNHMGAGAPGFTEQALGFHRAADKITAAAKQRDQAGVLRELGVTLKTCTSCHATWKQQVVSSSKFSELSRAAGVQPPSSNGMPH